MSIDGQGIGFQLDVKEYCRKDVEMTKQLLNHMYGVARHFEIKNVIFNPPATIVFWGDGTKTVVKDQGEGFDPEKGLAMAISKKALGNQGNYYNQFKKWTEKYDGPEYAGGVSVDEFIQRIRRVFGIKD